MSGGGSATAMGPRSSADAGEGSGLLLRTGVGIALRDEVGAAGGDGDAGLGLVVGSTGAPVKEHAASTKMSAVRATSTEAIERCTCRHPS